jgi:hypothetical protein
VAIAPFRLGLTATYDPRESKELNETIGPLAYWKPIRELSGKRLAPYEVIRLSVSLLPEERLADERESATYLDYWQGRSNRLAEDTSSSSRLQTLLQEQARDVRARRALQAFQQMRRIIAGADQDVVRYIKLCRLMHTITRCDRGYRIELDGPLSLLRGTKRYGLKMAVFLPALALCQNWRMETTIVKRGERLGYSHDDQSGLVSHFRRFPVFDSKSDHTRLVQMPRPRVAVTYVRCYTKQQADQRDAASLSRGGSRSSLL